MCQASHEIQEMKFVRECEGDGLTWRDYLYNKGDFYSFYDSVTYVDHEYVYSKNNSPCNPNNIYWLPTLEQYLKMYMNYSDIASESKAMLWFANYINDVFIRAPHYDTNIDTKE